VEEILGIAQHYYTHRALKLFLYAKIFNYPIYGCLLFGVNVYLFLRV